MKNFRKLSILFVVLLIAIGAIADILVIRENRDPSGLYRVEVKRLADEIRETGSYDLGKYPHLTAVYSSDTGSDLYRSDKPYVMIEEGGKHYRVEYRQNRYGRQIVIVNIFFAAVILTVILMLNYLYRHLIIPFGKINDVPKELARGNLAVPIPEEKSRFFGKFTWGVNLLRESIEKDREHELEMQRDKKMLLLSLSHDIKTPLSAIKLNSKALAKGLYKDEEKRREAAESINRHADEIENYVSQITRAAGEDFMSFEVSMGEEFLSRIVTKIYERYAAQLAISGTELSIGEYRDAILSCDPDRLAECLQNLVENAIKYGDGKSISLSFDRQDGCELITVRNTGCTLGSEELTEIFGSFRRGSNSDGVKGSGLGLFICRKLMTMMNGDIYADIEDGCFSVTLVVKMA